MRPAKGRLCDASSVDISLIPLLSKACTVCELVVSRTASDTYTGIIEKTGSKNVHAFQRLINGTVASGVFARLSTTKSAAARAWFASGFIGLYLCYSQPTSQVAGAYRLAYRSRFVRTARSCFAREGCGFS